MQCPQCQAECPPEAAFCQKCGAKIEPLEDAPPADPADELITAAPGAGAPHDRFKETTAPRPDDPDDQEDEIWAGSFSKKGMIGQWILAVVASMVALIVATLVPGIWFYTLLGIVVLWAMLGAYYAYKRLSVHYTLTTQRLIHESGILWRTIDRIELIDIDDVTFKQGPVERVFKVGTIIVISGDKTSPELSLPGIDQVRRIADEIDDARRKERRRRGLHMITQGAS